MIAVAPSASGATGPRCVTPPWTYRRPLPAVGPATPGEGDALFALPESA